MAQPQLPTLTEIEAAIWQQLARAPRDKHHEWRTPVLATAGAGGAAARTVVLREVHVANQQLVIYTDTRAAKVAQLRAQPHGSALDGAAGPSPQPVSHRACFAVIEAQVLAIDWLELEDRNFKRCFSGAWPGCVGHLGLARQRSE